MRRAFVSLALLWSMSGFGIDIVETGLDLDRDGVFCEHDYLVLRNAAGSDELLTAWLETFIYENGVDYSPFQPGGASLYEVPATRVARGSVEADALLAGRGGMVALSGFTPMTFACNGYFHSDCDTNQPWTFTRGDANDDETVNIADGIAISNYLFSQTIKTCPCNMDAMDVNDDGQINIADMSQVYAYCYAGGLIPKPSFRYTSAPPPHELPFGFDPTPDAIQPERDFDFNNDGVYTVVQFQEPSPSNPSFNTIASQDVTAFSTRMEYVMNAVNWLAASMIGSYDVRNIKHSSSNQGDPNGWYKGTTYNKNGVNIKADNVVEPLQYIGYAPQGSLAEVGVEFARYAEPNENTTLVKTKVAPQFFTADGLIPVECIKRWKDTSSTMVPQLQIAVQTRASAHGHYKTLILDGPFGGYNASSNAEQCFGGYVGPLYSWRNDCSVGLSSCIRPYWGIWDLNPATGAWTLDTERYSSQYPGAILDGTTKIFWAPHARPFKYNYDSDVWYARPILSQVLINAGQDNHPYTFNQFEDLLDPFLYTPQGSLDSAVNTWGRDTSGNWVANPDLGSRPEFWPQTANTWGPTIKLNIPWNVLWQSVLESGVLGETSGHQHYICIDSARLTNLAMCTMFFHSHYTASGPDPWGWYDLAECITDHDLFGDDNSQFNALETQAYFRIQGVAVFMSLKEANEYNWDSSY